MYLAYSIAIYIVALYALLEHKYETKWQVLSMCVTATALLLKHLKNIDIAPYILASITLYIVAMFYHINKIEIKKQWKKIFSK